MNQTQLYVTVKSISHSQNNKIN